MDTNTCKRTNEHQEEMKPLRWEKAEESWTFSGSDETGQHKFVYVLLVRGKERSGFLRLNSMKSRFLAQQRP